MKEHALLLFVDDNPNNLQVLGNLLASQYTTAIAENGHKALEFVQRRRPDLILLDIMLPDLDGFAVCQRLKAAPATRDIPVIFLTARTETDDLTRGFDIGAVDYITKPFHAQEVLARVKTHLRSALLQQQLAERNRQLQQEIEDRTRAEEQVRKLSRAVEQSASTIVITDLTGKIEFANPAFTHITGYTMQEVIAQGPGILQSGHHSPEFYQDLWATIQRGDVWRGEFINKKKHGELYWEAATISPVKDALGDITHYVAVKEDISERKRMEDALVESQQYTRNMIESSLNMIITVDPKRRIVEFNRAAEQAFGYCREEVIGQAVSMLFADPSEASAVGQTMVQETLSLHEVSHRRKNGERFSCLLSASTLHDAQGGVIGYMGISHDISELKQAQAELLAAHDELQEKNAQLAELNASKDKFFSIIAHDLRNPFNALLGYIDLMRDQLDASSPGEFRNYLEKVHLAARRLFALLNNLLTWSRIQRGAMEYAPETFELGSLAHDIVVLFSANADSKTIDLNSLIQEAVPVYADYAMLNTILRNMVSNAIKFTSRGGQVTIAARQTAREVEITVADTGKGMSQEAIGKLFRIDDQYTTQGTDGETGTGLGLVLCHELVRKHGGTIRVESEIGRGATFRFTLPSASDTNEALRSEKCVLVQS